MLRAVKDPEHVLKINALIPEAVRLTDEVIKRYQLVGGDKDWDRLFIAKMNKLAIDKGLRVPLETLMQVRKEMGLDGERY